jgi:fumarate reductase flavoprotein subunit
MMFVSAPTIEDLARKARLDPAGLADTVKAYNAGVRAKKDAFGRQHLPKPIAKPPYYAVIHHGHSATCSVGVVVDKELRVTRADGTPIPNLYAIGEVLGSGVTLGNAFTPGMLLTPALTFGKVLGERLAIG